MRIRLILMGALLGSTAGCGTTYSYHGYLASIDNTGTQRTFLLYWSKTERLLWFDEAEGTVRLLPENGKVIKFVEGESGIVLRRDPAILDQGGPERAVPVGGECGRVLTADLVEELPEGDVKLVIWCDGIGDEFAIGGKLIILKPRDEPYIFTIRRVEASTLPGGAPGFPRP